MSDEKQEIPSVALGTIQTLDARRRLVEAEAKAEAQLVAARSEAFFSAVTVLIVPIMIVCAAVILSILVWRLVS